MPYSRDHEQRISQRSNGAPGVSPGAFRNDQCKPMGRHGGDLVRLVYVPHSDRSPVIEGVLQGVETARANALEGIRIISRNNRLEACRINSAYWWHCELQRMNDETMRYLFGQSLAAFAIALLAMLVAGYFVRK